MSVYPDLYNLMDMFLHGVLETMHTEMFKNGLTPEANTVDDFIAEGKAIEEATKTQDHYRQYIGGCTCYLGYKYGSNPAKRE